MPTIYASDNFVRANENPLSDGGNWLIESFGTGLQIANSGLAQCSVFNGTTCYNYFNGGISWPNDQYSQVQIAENAVKTNTYGGVLLRVAPASTNFYGAEIGNNSTNIFKIVVGVFTQMAVTSYTWSANDTIYLQVEGTNLTNNINGVQKLTATDNQIASGFPGIYAQTNTGTDGGGIGNIALANFFAGSPYGGNNWSSSYRDFIGKHGSDDTPPHYW